MYIFQLYSKEVIYKCIKGLYDEVYMQERRCTERAESVKKRIRCYKKAADLLVKLRERLQIAKKKTFSE